MSCQALAQPKQKCTGYWIPIELSKLGLSKIEQFLLAMIDSLQGDAPDYCFATNKYLAEHMELSESRISFYITKFKRMGLIEEVGYDGRRRRLRTLKENWYKPPHENSKKDLCVKEGSQTTRSHVVRLRENTIHIIKRDTKENIDLDFESADGKIHFNYETKNLTGISESKIAQWKKQFASVDINFIIKEVSLHMASNPDKRFSSPENYLLKAFQNEQLKQYKQRTKHNGPRQKTTSKPNLLPGGVSQFNGSFARLPASWSTGGRPETIYG